MATTRFNSIIVAAARSLQAERTTAGPSGDSAANGFTSAVLSDYANRAVRDFIRDTFAQLKENFGNLIPEYVKRATLTLVAGVAALPSSAWLVLDVQTSDHATKFTKLESKEVDDVMAGQDGMMDPSASQPVFWQEGLNLYTLGVTTGNVIVRYIMKHEDITVVTASTGNGTIYTTAANLTWTAATKILTVAGQLHMFGGADETNKIIIFRTAAIVYIGRIVSYRITIGSDCEITLSGDGLPGGDIAAPNIIEFVVSDFSPDVNDILLNDQHFGDIITRMLAMAHVDLAMKV